ncbi:hypothetical protein BH24ACT11_BH24ACT11_02050 [soil metagenome]
MPTLVHLNGPSGAGKSQPLPNGYVDEHPGVLNLATDLVVALIGGWRDDLWGTLAPPRRIAIAMAEAHLSSGNDVVMPQLVTSLDEAQSFEDAAARVDADCLEIALIVDPPEQIRRFRAKSERSPVDRHVRRLVEFEGGDRLLEGIHRHFSEYLEQQPFARRVRTAGLDPDASYTALLSTLRWTWWLVGGPVRVAHGCRHSTESCLVAAGFLWRPGRSALPPGCTLGLRAARTLYVACTPRKGSLCHVYVARVGRRRPPGLSTQRRTQS